jgi:hypothetical protein
VECNDARQRLLELLYSEPGDGDPSELVAHIEQCRGCAAELDGLRRTKESLNAWTLPSRAMPPISHPGGGGSRVRANLRGAMLGAAAMLGLCAGTVGILGNISRGANGLTVTLPLAVSAATSSVTPEPTQEYMLLLHSRGEDQPPDSSEEERLVKEYSEWAGQLGRRGQLVSAEKLGSDDAVVLRREGAGVRANPLDFGAAEAHVAGFFQVRAGSFAQAQIIARECPHLKYGGGVEIRRIEKTR